MNEKLKAFLDSKKEEEKKQYEKYKNDTLLELGLYEKTYSESVGGYNTEYPESEWDNEKQQSIWYKKIAIEISDEEFEQIEKYINKNSTENNSVAYVLSAIAWFIYICGFVLGIIFASDFSLEIAIIYWFVSLVSGTIFLGFAEIIKLLTAIKNK